MTHYRKFFDSDYIGAYDLEDGDRTLTIESVGRETIFVPQSNSEETKFVLRFAEARKGMVCNRTNADSIAQLYGSDADQWVGKQITLYPAKVKAFGKVQEAIRVRTPEAKLK